MKGTARVAGGILAALLEEAARYPMAECCGLLAGRGGVITKLYPAPNVAENAVREFESAPVELFRIFRAMREAGLEHLGIYHSHPRGENTPSARDLELAYYPGIAYFILSPDPAAAQPVRAFLLEEESFAEMKIQAV
jgi:proteasome lid subunit RPN8/RPN11